MFLVRGYIHGRIVLYAHRPGMLKVCVFLFLFVFCVPVTNGGNEAWGMLCGGGYISFQYVFIHKIFSYCVYFLVK